MTYPHASIALSVPSVSEAATWFQNRFPSARVVDHREELAVVRLGSTQLVLLQGPADPHWRSRPVLVEVAPQDFPLGSVDDVEVQEQAKTQLGARWATLKMPGQTYQLVLVTPVPPLSDEQLDQVRKVLRPLKEKVAKWHEVVQAESKRLRASLEEEISSLEEEREIRPEGGLEQGTSLSSSNVDELDALSPRQRQVLEKSIREMADFICQLAEITRAHVWILGNKELYGKQRRKRLFYPFFQRLAEFYKDHPTLKERLYLSNHPSRGSLFTELPITNESLDHGLEVALRAHSRAP